MPFNSRNKNLIAIVGPCAAGKTTLARELEQRGYRAKQVVQEHSHVPDMWRQISQPDQLIFLDASFEECTRRKDLDWSPKDYHEEQNRLRHARQHCDLYLDTNDLSPEEVTAAVLEHLAGGQSPAEPV